MTFGEAIETSLASLQSYGSQYRHWSIAYSGGKDSSATVSFVNWAIKSGLVDTPETLTVLYADTRQELPPLAETAQRLLADLRQEGVNAQTVLPDLDNRFYVYMLGRGVPPPSNTFRWCTERIKIKPMADALQALSDTLGGARFLQITGVRMGESAVRDQRIAISCNSNKGECGQGWFQEMSSGAIADTLAPLVHWRSCFVWDWLTLCHSDAYMHGILGYAQGHGYPYLHAINAAYGDDDARTGCVGCKLASRDVALEYVLTQDDYAHLTPLLEIRPVLEELKRPHRRLRKPKPERTKAGRYAKNGQRMGPLTFEARRWALERILDIQARAGVDLINAEEEARIRELWHQKTWPQGWDGTEVRADIPLDTVIAVGEDLVVQPLLLKSNGSK